MKIAQILPKLNVGGVETGTVDLAKALKKRGDQPFVISDGGSLVPELVKAGIPHLKLPVHKKSCNNRKHAQLARLSDYTCDPGVHTTCSRFLPASASPGSPGA